MRAGFTLLEIIVAMAVLGVFIGYAVINLQNSNSLQKQSAAFAELKQVMHLAKSNALSGKKAPECTDPLVGWRVKLAAASYTIEGVCDVDYPTAPVATFFSRQVILPAGVTISVNPDLVTEVVFRTLGQGVATNRFPIIDPAVVVTVTDGVNSSAVTISNLGDIDEN